jgi:hypothetical protein
MTEATRCLTLSEAGARKKKNENGGAGKAGMAVSRFPPGLEWEILVADAVVMLGLTHALGYVDYSVIYIISANMFVTASRIWDISNACDYSLFLVLIVYILQTLYPQLCAK